MNALEKAVVDHPAWKRLAKRPAEVVNEHVRERLAELERCPRARCPVDTPEGQCHGEEGHAGLHWRWSES